MSLQNKKACPSFTINNVAFPRFLQWMNIYVRLCPVLYDEIKSPYNRHAPTGQLCIVHVCPLVLNLNAENCSKRNKRNERRNSRNLYVKCLCKFHVRRMGLKFTPVSDSLNIYARRHSWHQKLREGFDIKKKRYGKEKYRVGTVTSFGIYVGVNV